MHNQTKSPLSKTHITPQKPSKSMTHSKRSNHTIVSHSKAMQSKFKEISQSQVYKNILNKMLRKDNLLAFVQEALQYVQLTEDFIPKDMVNTVELVKSRAQTQHYGNTLIKDGSFIKYFCKLAQKEFKDRQKQLRLHFFNKYKNAIVIRQIIFNDYFKDLNQEETKSWSCSRSKHVPQEKEKSLKKSVKSKENDLNQNNQVNKSKHPELKNFKDNIISQKKSENIFNLNFGNSHMKKQKTISQLDQHSKYQDSDLHPNSAFDPVDNRSLNKFGVQSDFSQKSASFYKSNSFLQRKTNNFIDKNLQNHNSPLSKEYQQSQSFTSPFKKSNLKRRNETQQERELRLAGLVKQSAVKSGKKKNVVTFQDTLNSNSKLQQIYSSIKKQRQIKQLNQSSKKALKIDKEQAIVRPSINEKMSHLSEIRLKRLTNQTKSQMNEIQKQIIDKFSTIQRRGKIQGVKFGYSQIIGHYKNYILKITQATDVYQFLEPTYTALILQRMNENNKTNVSEYVFTGKQNFEILLIE